MNDGMPAASFPALQVQRPFSFALACLRQHRWGRRARERDATVACLSPMRTQSHWLRPCGLHPAVHDDATACSQRGELRLTARSGGRTGACMLPHACMHACSAKRHGPNGLVARIRSHASCTHPPSWCVRLSHPAGPMACVRACVQQRSWNVSFRWLQRRVGAQVSERGHGSPPACASLAADKGLPPSAAHVARRRSAHEMSPRAMLPTDGRARRGGGGLVLHAVAVAWLAPGPAPVMCAFPSSAVQCSAVPRPPAAALPGPALAQRLASPCAVAVAVAVAVGVQGPCSKFPPSMPAGAGHVCMLPTGMY